MCSEDQDAALEAQELPEESNEQVAAKYEDESSGLMWGFAAPIGQKLRLCDKFVFVYAKLVVPKEKSTCKYCMIS